MMSDLRQRVPAHSLIDELLHQWDLGTIYLGESGNEVVIDDEAVGWYRGVIGEKRVASILDQLGDGWTVIHSVPVGVGTSDIDHIAIGPPGVFTINTKYSPGKNVWVAGQNLQISGHPQQYVYHAIHEVDRAVKALERATALNVRVSGLIVFVDPKTITVREAPGDAKHDIRVVADSELLAALGGEAILMPQEVERIVEAAARPETWHQSPSESSIGEHITDEFAALEAAVGPRLAEPVARTGNQRAKRVPVAKQPASRPTVSRKRPANASRRPLRRSKGHQRNSRLEGLVSALVFLGLAWFISQPAGQALIASLFQSLVTAR